MVLTETTELADEIAAAAAVAVAASGADDVDDATLTKDDAPGDVDDVDGVDGHADHGVRDVDVSVMAFHFVFSLAEAVEYVHLYCFSVLSESIFAHAIEFE